MLHRLIHKPPVPLEPVPLDKAIFSKKGKIRISALTICKEMGIDPQDIYPKSLEDFAEKDVPANVQILRFNGYETQRRIHLQAIKEKITKQIENKSPQLSPVITMLTPSKDSVTRTSPSPLNQLKLDVSPPLKAEYPSFSGRTNEDEGERARRKVSFKRNAKTPSTLTGNSFVLPRGSQMGEGKTEESVILTNMTTETQCNEEGSILKTLHNNYKKHLQSRSVQKERLVNASVIVTKNEERLREKLREDYLERERRWLEKKQKLLQPKKEYNKIDNHLQYVRHRLMTEQKEEEEMALKRQTELNERLAQSEKKRREENEKKYTRIKERNKLIQKRYSNVVEKMEEKERSPVKPDLDEIQRKFQVTQERKEKFLQEKKRHQMLRFSFDAQEKIRKLQMKQEEEEKKRLQDMAEKLERVKMRESSSPLRKNKTGSTSIKSDVKQRLEEIRKQEEMNMKQKIQEFTEKEKRALERLQQKRSSMGEYIAERREIREQRFYNTKLNISLAEEEYNKWIDETSNSYRTKVEGIQRERKWKTKQAKIMGKNETANKTILIEDHKG